MIFLAQCNESENILKGKRYSDLLQNYNENIFLDEEKDNNILTFDPTNSKEIPNIDDGSNWACEENNSFEQFTETSNNEKQLKIGNLGNFLLIKYFT